MACYEAADVLKVNPLTSSSQGGRSGQVGLGEVRGERGGEVCALTDANFLIHVFTCGKRAAN